MWIGIISIPLSSFARKRLPGSGTNRSGTPSSSHSTAAYAPLMHVNMHCRAVDERLNKELFDSLDDARRKLALWRYDYNHVRPHSSLGNQTPAQARRALEQFDSSAHDALAQNETEEYEIQTRKLSLGMREPRGAGQQECN